MIAFFFHSNVDGIQRYDSTEKKKNKTELEWRAIRTIFPVYGRNNGYDIALNLSSCTQDTSNKLPALPTVPVSVCKTAARVWHAP